MQETTRKYKGKQEWEFSAICTSVCWKIKLSLRVESVLEVALKKMIFELDLKQLVGIVILEHKKVLKKKKEEGVEGSGGYHKDIQRYWVKERSEKVKAQHSKT